MGWLYCAYYTGLSSHTRCAADIEYSAVACRQLTQCTHYKRHTDNYPCCREWAGMDTCERREWEVAPKVWNDGMRQGQKEDSQWKPVRTRETVVTELHGEWPDVRQEVVEVIAEIVHYHAQLDEEDEILGNAMRPDATARSKAE